MAAELDLLVRGRRILTAGGIGPGAVGIRQGRIAAVGPPERATGAARLVDLADDEVLLPGLVDTHVHVNEPGRTGWEGFASATRAAAAGGITTIVDMPLNSIPPTTDAAALRVKRAAARGQCRVDVGFWGGAVPGNNGELAALRAAGVPGFKCFMVDSGVPEFPPLDDHELEQAMRQVAALGSLLIVHAEDPAGIVPLPARRTAYADFLRSRPARTEEAAIAKVVELARGTGARVHILHLSSAGAAALIAAAKQDGLPITAETCPHYLVFAAEDIPDGATQFKCCPPIRERAHRDLLWQALEAGVIDAVVSDHSPCPPELKQMERGDFAAAWGGISSLQLGLAVVWTQARARGHGLDDVARWMATRPAALARLRRKGLIAPGYDADLVAFAPGETFVVAPDRLHHRHPLTPYAGHRLYGVVRRTWLRGATVLDGGEPAGRLAAAEEP
ncbi:MAG TPA: allantoinase AllB [Streptosporangiaceae bacterium]|nr:allantoinase AllB [Streptosporangiaceae bacterium]